MVDRIKYLCKINNTTVKALEEDLRLGKATVRRWDENSPSIEKVALVAERFGVSLDYLVWGKGEQDGHVGGLSVDTEEIANIIESLSPDRRRLLLLQARALKQEISNQGNPGESP